MIGLSGGPDSIFLLHVLKDMAKELGISLCAANLDHGIRGKASMRDSLFAVNTANNLGIRCFHKKLSCTKKELSGKLSLEEFLREKRYNFFKEALANMNANILATGHTLDDQAETVLIRVIKGTTIKGLAGIMPAGIIENMSIIRPLIELEKKQITNFLKKENISFCLDKSNLEIRFFRNTVRKKIIPYLKKYNPRITRSLALMADSLREDRDFIEEAKKMSGCGINKENNRVSIKLKAIVVQPRALQREILRDALLKLGSSVKKLTYRHWKDMENFLIHKRGGQSLDLPDNVTLQRTDKNIQFQKKN